MKHPTSAAASVTARKPKAKILNATMSVQIPADIEQRLADQCAKSGLAKNLVARQAILAAIQMMERDGGLFLPLSFPPAQ